MVAHTMNSAKTLVFKPFHTSLFIMVGRLALHWFSTLLFHCFISKQVSFLQVVSCLSHISKEGSLLADVASFLNVSIILWHDSELPATRPALPYLVASYISGRMDVINSC